MTASQYPNIVLSEEAKQKAKEIAERITERDDMQGETTADEIDVFRKELAGLTKKHNLEGVFPMNDPRRGVAFVLATTICELPKGPIPVATDQLIYYSMNGLEAEHMGGNHAAANLVDRLYQWMKERH
jgi:hypothetical protein